MNDCFNKKHFTASFKSLQKFRLHFLFEMCYLENKLVKLDRNVNLTFFYILWLQIFFMGDMKWFQACKHIKISGERSLVIGHDVFALVILECYFKPILTETKCCVWGQHACIINFETQKFCFKNLKFITQDIIIIFILSTVIFWGKHI